MTETTNQPFAVSEDEWQEIIKMPAVREAWGLEDETIEEFSKLVYAAKFNFLSGGPSSYTGDLYILQGDALTGDAPLLLGRREGRLYPIYH